MALYWIQLFTTNTIDTSPNISGSTQVFNGTKLPGSTDGYSGPYEQSERDAAGNVINEGLRYDNYHYSIGQSFLYGSMPDPDQLEVVTKVSAISDAFGDTEEFSDGYRWGVYDVGPPSPTEPLGFSLTKDNTGSVSLSEDAHGQITISGASKSESQTGAIRYSDIGATDLPSATVTSESVKALDSHGHDVNLQASQVDAIEACFSLSAATGTPDTGEFGWTFNPTEALNFLTDGETVTLTANVYGTDDRGQSDTSSVDILINGPAAGIAGFDVQKYPGSDELKYLHDNTNLKAIGFYLSAPNYHDSTNPEKSWEGKGSSLADWQVEPIYLGRQPDLLKDERPDLAFLGKRSANEEGQKEGLQASTEIINEGLSGTVYFDCEAHGGQVQKDQGYQKFLKAWVKTVRNEGLTPGFYSFLDTCDVVSKLFPNMPLWVAKTGGKKASNAFSGADATAGSNGNGAVVAELSPANSGLTNASGWQYAIDKTNTVGLPNFGGKVDFDVFAGANSV